jgi:hypothetical protein
MSTYSSFKPGVAGVATLTAGTDTAVNTSTGAVKVWNTSTLQSITNRGSTTNNSINISNSSQSTSTITGALLVQGGVGVGGNINAGGTVSATTITVATNLAASSATFSGIITDTSGIPSVSTVTGAIVITNGGGIGVGGQVNAAKVVTVDQTAATTAGAGSLNVGGGAYIANNLVVMSSQSSTGTTSSNALYVAGGVGIGGGLLVGGSAVFSGPIYFSGSATSVVSSNTVYTSNLITLHSPPAGAWTVDDGRDIGIKFRFYSNTDTSAVLVLANDTKYLEFYGAGASGTSTFSTASYGTFKTGAIILVTSTNATSTTTGALQVAGGVAVGLDTWIGGIETINSTLDATTNTGALLVKSGGASIAKSLYVGSTNANPAANTGNSIVVAGGIGISSSAYIGGNVLINSSTISTSTNTGQALIVKGGVGAQAVYASALYDNTSRVVTNIIPTAGNGITISNLSITGTTVVFTITNTGINNLQAGPGISITTSTTSATISNIGVTSIAGTAGQISVNTSTGAVVLSLPGGLSFNTSTVSTLYITGQQASISTNSGALQVVGGVGIGSSIYVGSTATINGSLIRKGNISAAGWTTSTNGIGLSFAPATYTETLTSGSFLSSVVSINSFGSPTISNSAGASTYGDVATLYIDGAPIAGTNVTITNPWGLIVNNGNVKINSTTPSNSVGGGALVVGGGIGVGGNIVAGGTGQFSSGGVLIGSTLVDMFTFTTNSTNPQIINSYSAISYRTARYLIQAVSSSSVHVTEMTVFHNGSVVYKDEYGISTNNGELGTFDATLSLGTVSLTFTPFSATPVSITASRTLLAV